MRRKYVCIAKCPTLDLNNKVHCVLSVNEKVAESKYLNSCCPYNQTPKWILVNPNNDTK